MFIEDILEKKKLSFGNDVSEILYPLRRLRNHKKFTVLESIDPLFNKNYNLFSDCQNNLLKFLYLALISSLRPL